MNATSQAADASPPTSSAPLLSIAVMGAGAVGCYFGAMLARAGHKVTLIGRQAHVQAVQKNGLRLQTAKEDLHVPMEASTEVSAIQGADVVLFCVKSTDTETAAQQIQPYLTNDTLVLTLQNGVDNDERARTMLGDDAQSPSVAAAVVYVATAMAGPGHVRHFGRGELVIAPSARSQAVAEQFTAAGIPAQVSDNVRNALWAKLVINCAYNALSALTHMPYDWLVAQDVGVNPLIDDIIDECAAVARAEGIALPANMREMVHNLPGSMPGQLSSTAQDLARGKLTEIDHLNGYVVHRGKVHGIATPINQTLLVLVRLAQTQRMPATRTNAPTP